jgi:tRNA(Ile)-lysidine synthase
VTDDLVERFLRHVVAHRLFPAAGRVVLAVSGGPDSLALLDLVARVGPRLGLEPVVAHADHGIQPGSGDVARHVEELVKTRYALPVVVSGLALGPATGETRAREARYRFLREVQASREARYLVTAHHADDQVETILMRLLRGTAPAGLAGIRARGPHGLVRPLLPFGREELRTHVLALGLEPADDPANRDPRHLRSWVRKELLPSVVSHLGEAGRLAFLEVASHARAELRAWDAAVDRLPGLGASTSPGRFDVAREVLGSYDKWLGERVLRAVAARAGLVLAPRAAARLAQFARVASSGRRLELPGGLSAEAAFGRLVVCRPAPLPQTLALAGRRGRGVFGGFTVAWTTEPAPPRLERTGWTTWLAPGAAQVRAVHAGDRVVPLGGVGRRAVSRLLMEAKVPRGERSRYPVVVADGAVAWVPGVCRGARAVPPAGTEATRVDVTVR